MLTDLQNQIQELITLKREGSFWDFKQEYHANRASLLHDIICLSNSSHKGNRYLIFGVSDPAKGAEIIGINPNCKNRKSQVEIIDFLRSKHFAGESRPEVQLQTLCIEDKEVDVLIVFNNIDKPYYMKKDYQEKGKKVRANYIYTRTNDTNTPIDKSADIGLVEKMWRERFGIDISPLERMKLLLLKPDEWLKDIGNKPYAYHKEFPEFRIEFSRTKEFQEVFSFFFTNYKSYLGDATFKYHSTTLFELEYMYCDEMRIEFAVPKTVSVKLQKDQNWFYYYILEELNGIFLQFITDNLTKLRSRSSSFPFVIFKTEFEKKMFIENVIAHENEFWEIEPDYWSMRALKEMKQQKYGSVIDPIFIDRILKFKEQN